MDRRFLLNSIGWAPIALFSRPTFSKTELINGLKRRWGQSKAYTLAVLEAMPATHLEYRPTESQLSFAQHFVNLGYWNNLYLGFMVDPSEFTDSKDLFEAPYLIKKPDGIQVMGPDALAERSADQNKKVLKDYLVQTFDFSIEAMSKIKDRDLAKGQDKPQPGFLAGHSNLDLILRGESHTSHHRGQAIVYLRLKNVAPPNYAKFNAF